MKLLTGLLLVVSSSTTSSEISLTPPLLLSSVDVYSLAIYSFASSSSVVLLSPAVLSSSVVSSSSVLSSSSVMSVSLLSSLVSSAESLSTFKCEDVGFIIPNNRIIYYNIISNQFNISYLKPWRCFLLCLYIVTIVCPRAVDACFTFYYIWTTVPISSAAFLTTLYQTQEPPILIMPYPTYCQRGA